MYIYNYSFHKITVLSDSKEERAAVLRAHSKALAPKEGIYDNKPKVC